MLVRLQGQRMQGPDQRILDMQRVALERRIAPLQRCVGVACLALHLRASDGGRFLNRSDNTLLQGGSAAP